MVSASCDSNGNICRVIAEPDRSLNPHQTLWFLASISFVVLSIALGFALIGAWLVLPFAGIELVALALALYLSQARGIARETVHIDAVEVAVSRVRAVLGADRREEPVARFPTAWLRVRRGAGRGWYPRRLFIGASGRWVELGGFLTEEQRKRFGDEIEARLALVIRRHCPVGS